MRSFAAFGALLVVVIATKVAQAEDAPASPTPPPDESATRAELARQAASIDALKREVLDAKHEKEHPALRVSGYVQVDWIVHDGQSQNEVNGSTGQPLNQDRFTLRRGHVRIDAQRGILQGALEIDANTTSGPQVRPIEADVSLHWPER